MRTLITRKYKDDILQSVVRLMLLSHLGVIYQQDNVHPHTSRVSKQYLQGYNVLSWIVNLLDLAPIENIWDRYERLLRPFQNSTELVYHFLLLW